MRRYRILPCFTLVILALVAVLSTAVMAGETRDWRVGFSQCNLGEPWRANMYEELKSEIAKRPDSIDLIHKDARDDTARQQAHMRGFIDDFKAGDLDCIVVSPRETAALTEVVGEAHKAGCPVIVIDREILSDEYTTFIGADNTLIGRTAGEWAKDKFGGKKAKAIELTGSMTVSAAVERNSGFMEGVEGSDIEIILRTDMNWFEPVARREMELALERFDKIDFVFAHNDPGAHGAYLAAKAAGREKEICFVGVDALPHEGVAYVRQGILEATFLYPNGMDIMLDCVMKLKRGEKLPKRIVLATKVFDQDSLEGRTIGRPIVIWE